MKNIITVISLLMVCGASCKKSNGSKEDQLPPATQTGANTFGCLINGKVYVPKGYNGTGTPNPKITYNLGLNGLPILAIDAKRLNNSNNFEGGVIISFQSIVGLGEYTFPNNFNFSVGWPVLLSSCGTDAYDTTILKIGGGILTRYDPINRIFSGTFNCKFKTLTCDTVYITNGRFDFKL